MGDRSSVLQSTLGIAGAGEGSCKGTGREARGARLAAGRLGVSGRPASDSLRLLNVNGARQGRQGSRMEPAVGKVRVGALEARAVVHRAVARCRWDAGALGRLSVPQRSTTKCALEEGCGRARARLANRAALPSVVSSARGPKPDLPRGPRPTALAGDLERPASAASSDKESNCGESRGRAPPPQRH